MPRPTKRQEIREALDDEGGLTSRQIGSRVNLTTRQVGAFCTRMPDVEKAGETGGVSDGLAVWRLEPESR